MSMLTCKSDYTRLSISSFTCKNQLTAAMWFFAPIPSIVKMRLTHAALSTHLSLLSFSKYSPNEQYGLHALAANIDNDKRSFSCILAFDVEISLTLCFPSNTALEIPSYNKVCIDSVNRAQHAAEPSYLEQHFSARPLKWDGVNLQPNSIPMTSRKCRNRFWQAI